VAINCSAIPENLLESELFGHAKGAFTGAIDKKMGLFEEADGGTLFLDEIGDLSLPLQAKLLRVLQEKEIKRVGENQPRAIDVRVIAATHKDLRHEVQEKRFREDLFFRLNVIPIKIPPLRDRREDILPLAEFFLKKFNVLNGTHITGFKKNAKEFLLIQPWRGNVRELENSIERAVVLSSGNEIDMSSFILFEENMDISVSTEDQ
jgi:two-component system response regulator HydG